MSSKRKRQIIAYGLVTRYGPQTNCQRKRLIKHQKLILRIYKLNLSSNVTFSLRFKNYEFILQLVGSDF